MGKTKDLGHLAHIVAYNAENHITVPAGITMHTNQLVASQSWVTTELGSYALSTSLGSYVPTSRTITINGTSYDLSANRSWDITSMIYPAAGIPLSTGTAWGTSITDNSVNWNTAYGWGNHASAGYLTGITSAQVTSALGYTPYNSTNPNGYITSSGNISGYAMSLNGYANQTEYTILTGPANGPVIKVRYDGSTANRYIDIGSKDGNGVYYEGFKIYNGGTPTWAGNAILHAGNYSSYNDFSNLYATNYFQSITGRAAGNHGYASTFRNTQSASSNFIPYSFESEYGNHSWGIVARYRINQVGADRPSIQFSAAGGDDRWNVGYCTGSDWNFRITQNMAYRNDNANSDGWGTERFLIDTSGNIYANGLIQSNASLRAPIFYDSNDTGYYLDPNSTSYLHYIQMPHRGNGTPNIRVNDGNEENWRAIHVGNANFGIGISNSSRSWSGRESFAFHVDASKSFRVHSDGWDSLFEVWGSSGYAKLKGSLEVGSDVYLGTRGTWLSSWLNQSVTTGAAPTFNNIYNNGWFRNYGDSGLYNQDYGGHFRRSTASHGTWEVYGYTKGGYVGINIIDQGGYYNNLMYEYGTGGCYQENGGGWHYYYSRGNDCIGLSGSETYDWVRATTNGKHRITNDSWCDATSWAYTFSNISDGRLKQNIVTVDSALEKVLQLRGVYYSWIIDTENKKHIGLIAQETAEVCPEVVNYHDETDTYSVNYSELSGLFVESTKELNQKLIDANARIELLETKLNQLLNA